jgi:hypothetical protein
MTFINYALSIKRLELGCNGGTIPFVGPRLTRNLHCRDRDKRIRP